MGFVEELVNLEPAALRIPKQAGKRRYVVRRSLQRQQAASGLSPRSDMVAADQRLGYQLDQAEASLQQGDAASAKKRLDAAERELEKLEAFLGK